MGIGLGLECVMLHVFRDFKSGSVPFARFAAPLVPLSRARRQLWVLLPTLVKIASGQAVFMGASRGVTLQTGGFQAWVPEA